jgi:hypothetical protein
MPTTSASAGVTGILEPVNRCASGTLESENAEMVTAQARISFPGGGLVVPAHTPYERQQLLEHVRGCLRRAGTVRVRLDCTTWLVEWPDSGRPVCGGCGQPIRHAVSHRSGKAGVPYCLTCALARPHLTIAFLSALPAGTILRDVQARYAYGREWIPWIRWPQATPAEIISDIHLQRRYAPVLTWHCAELCVPKRSTPPAALPRSTAATSPLHYVQA